MDRQQPIGVCVSLFAVLLSCSMAFADEIGPPGAKLMGDLPAVLEAAGSGDRIPVYFVLADQLEGDALRARVAALTAGAAPPAGAAGKAARRQATVSALREHAAQAQAGLLAALRALEAQGAAARVRPLWIGNVVGADLAPDAVRALAARPEVVRVNWNPKRDVFLGARASSGPSRRAGRLARPLRPVAAGAGRDRWSGHRRPRVRRGQDARTRGLERAGQHRGRGRDRGDRHRRLLDPPRHREPDLGQSGRGPQSQRRRDGRRRHERRR